MKLSQSGTFTCTPCILIVLSFSYLTIDVSPLKSSYRMMCMQGALKEDLGMDLEMPFAADLVTSLKSNSDFDLMLDCMADQDEEQAADHSIDNVEQTDNVAEQPVARQDKTADFC